MSQENRIDTQEVRHPEWPEQFRTFMTIPEAADALDIKYPGYVRTLIKKERVEAVKLAQGGREIWAIDPETVQHYADNRGSFGRSTSSRGGVRRIMVRVDTDMLPFNEALEKIREALGEAAESVRKPKSYYKSKSKDDEDDGDEDEQWNVVESLIPEEDEESEDDEGLADGMNL